MPILTIGLMAVTLLYPVNEVKQPPAAPPCEHSDPTCITPTESIEVGIDPNQLAYAPPPPPFAFQAPDSPRAPQVLAVISCLADDLTGQPGRHGVDSQGHYDESSAAKGWRDLEPRVVNGQLTCKVEYVPLEDAITMYYPKKGEGLTAEALNSNFGNPGQCARVGAFIMPEYAKGGWSPVAIGCPSPIVDADGKIVDWHLPQCPRKLGSYEGFTCRFTPSEI